MTIAKFIKNTLKEIFEKMDNLYGALDQNVHNKNPESVLGRFTLSIRLKDKEIKIENLNEFENLKKLQFIKTHLEQLTSYIIFSERKGFREIFKMYLFCQAEYSAVDISSNDVDLIEKIFNEMENLGFIFYKYNPKIETVQRIEKVREKCVQLLKNFDSYQLRLKNPFKNEKDLKDFLFPILKSHFKNLEDEFHLPRFATIEYIPDFGIPKGKLLIECKFLKTKREIKTIQKQINDDVIGYLSKSSNYNRILFFIYNSNNVPIPEKFKKDIQKIKGVEDLIISPGVNII